MSMIEARTVRDRSTAHFARREFADGERLLQQHRAELPAVVVLECEGNLHFYRRELREAVRCYEAAIVRNPA